MAVIQSKRIGIRSGWGCQVTRHQVIEGFFRGGILSKRHAHIKYTYKRDGSFLLEQRHLTEAVFRFESGWVFRGRLDIAEGILQRGDEVIRIQQILPERRKEGVSKTEAKSSRRQEFHAVHFKGGLWISEGKLQYKGSFLFRTSGDFAVHRKIEWLREE